MSGTGTGASANATRAAPPARRRRRARARTRPPSARERLRRSRPRGCRRPAGDARAGVRHAAAVGVHRDRHALAVLDAVDGRAALPAHRVDVVVDLARVDRRHGVVVVPLRARRLVAGVAGDVRDEAAQLRVAVDAEAEPAGPAAQVGGDEDRAVVEVLVAVRCVQPVTERKLVLFTEPYGSVSAVAAGHHVDALDPAVAAGNAAVLDEHAVPGGDERVRPMNQPVPIHVELSAATISSEAWTRHGYAAVSGDLHAVVGPVDRLGQRRRLAERGHGRVLQVLAARHVDRPAISGRGDVDRLDAAARRRRRRRCRRTAAPRSPVRRQRRVLVRDRRVPDGGIDLRQDRHAELLRAGGGAASSIRRARGASSLGRVERDDRAHERPLAHRAAHGRASPRTRRRDRPGR